MIKSFNTPAMQARRAQAGITLIEVSIGLIIAAIIAAAAFIAFQNNARRSEVRENTQTLTEIFSESKQKFGRTVGYTGLTLSSLITAAVIPPNLATNATTASNSYGGAISISGTPTADQYQLVWGGVEQDQCLDLVLAVEEGAAGIIIGSGTPVKAPAVGGGTPTPAVAFNLAAATSQCGALTAPTNLTFTIARN